MQSLQQRPHTLALRPRPRVAGIAEGIEAALIADADGVLVVVLAVGTDLTQRPPLMHLPIARVVVMVSDVLPPLSEVVGLATIKAVALCRARRTAMCDDVVACAGARSQTQSHEIGTEARRAKHQKRGFYCFCHHHESFFGYFVYLDVQIV